MSIMIGVEPISQKGIFYPQECVRVWYYFVFYQLNYMMLWEVKIYTQNKKYFVLSVKITSNRKIIFFNQILASLSQW